MNHRIEKVNSLLKKEVSEILAREVDFPPGFLVTVMEVDASHDLCYAKVLVSIMPQAKEGKALEYIEKNLYQIQGRLNKRLVMKTVPRLCFKPYPHGRKTERINELLDKESQEIKKSKNPEGR